MARTPAPTKLKELKGYPGRRKREYKGKEPQPPAGSPPCPQHIKDDPVAYEEWIYVCEQLDTMQILTQADRAVIETYCTAYSDWRKARADVLKYGNIHVCPSGHIQVSAFATNENKAFQKLFRLLEQLGLTPAARARMRVEQTKDHDNPWAGLVCA